MLAWPCLATIRLATRSGKDVPPASSVSPRIPGEKPSNAPNSLACSTMISTRMPSHTCTDSDG